MANNRLILQPGQTAGAILGNYDVFGTNAGHETVVVFDNTAAYFQADFARGGDTVRLADTATDFTVRLVGSNAEFVSASDSLIARIPIGSAGVTVQFETAPGVYGDSRMLSLSGGNALFGGQVVTSTATAVAPAAPAGPAAFAAGPTIESAASDEQAAAKSALAAFTPSMEVHDGAHAAALAAAAAAIEQIEAGFSAHNALGGGFANFIVNFA